MATVNVRDRREMEELVDALKRSEEEYRTLFETLPDGIVHYERDGSVIGANRAALEIIGLAADQTSVADRALRLLHEDGTPYQPEDLPVMVALRTGEVVSGVVAAVRDERTGEAQWVRITAVPVARDDQGKPRRAYSVFTEITQERRAQAGLRESNRLLGRLRDANVLGVVVADEEGIQEANDAYLDIIGYTRDDLEAGCITWAAIMPSDWATSPTKSSSSCAGLERTRRTTRSPASRRAPRARPLRGGGARSRPVALDDVLRRPHCPAA